MENAKDLMEDSGSLTIVATLLYSCELSSPANARLYPFNVHGIQYGRISFN